jgi:hypothetical protein
MTGTVEMVIPVKLNLYEMKSAIASIYVVP